MLVSVKAFSFSIECRQKGRLEEQIRQHNEKRAAAVSETESTGEKKNNNEDESYEVTLDDDFLTALEYGMPPASGMVLSSLSLSLFFLAFSFSFWHLSLFQFLDTKI